MATKLAAARLGLLGISLMLIAGCSTMTVAEREEREYSRVDFRNKFVEDRARCTASGGQFHVLGYGGALDRNGIPRNRVRYVCS